MTSYESLRDWLKFYPIKGVLQYPNGYIEVVRVSRETMNRQSTNGKREKIMEFSDKSRREMLFTLHKLDVKWISFITLTYPRDFPVNGEAVKRDLNYWLTKYRRYWRNNGLEARYFWFLEFQERGAPHYHIITDKPDYRDRNRQFEAIWWAKRVSAHVYTGEPDTMVFSLQEQVNVYKVHYHQKAFQPIREENGAIKYAAKYAYKAKQKIVPSDYDNVGRFWGVSRNCPEHKPEWIELNEDGLRQHLKHIGHAAAEWEFVPKSLFGAQG